ncbi:MAG: recombinase family protein [Bacteroidota bacterium]
MRTIKRKAYLYVRVSTDEQADKYSPKHQYDRLLLYCQHENIEIIEVYYEDYSAKTFDRPEFKKLLGHLKGNRHNADLLLFLKWDRFSRNVAEAYIMINRLNKLGIEPQAIEQPLDFNIPESKIMLAIYLAAPEVENDRRSLNTIAGMRRAMKEGRHVNLAPRGYKNARDESGHPIIIPGKDAETIQWAYKEIARGINNIMDVWRMVKQRGLKIGKSQMWSMLRNPVYNGKIFIPAYKDEDATTVKAQHEPLIDDDLFNDVQDILRGRKRKRDSKCTLKEELPLRGHLLCSRCGNRLTGSASKGNGGKYFYYHCSNGCKERFKALEANEAFRKELAKIIPDADAIELYNALTRNGLYLSDKQKAKLIEPLKVEIEKCNERLRYARQLRLDKEIDAKEYQETRDEYEVRIRKAEKEISEIRFMEKELGKQLEFCTGLISNLLKHYDTVDIQEKQQIIGSIYPEKLVFDGKSYRTIRINEVVSLDMQSGQGFQRF